MRLPPEREHVIAERRRSASASDRELLAHRALDELERLGDVIERVGEGGGGAPTSRRSLATTAAGVKPENARKRSD